MMNYTDYKNRSYRNQEEVNETRQMLCCLPKVGSFAIHERVVGEPMKIMFHGCCDLTNNIEMLIEKQSS